MTKPKKAIEELWVLGFFEKRRSLREVKKRLWGRYKITPSNIVMTLRLKSVKKFLIELKGGYWKQRCPPVRSDEIEVHYFEPGKPRTSRQNFAKILNALTGEIKICDPYLNNDTLEALEQLKNAKVKFLTINNKNNIKVSQRDLKDFKAENANIDIRGFSFDHLHDRYIISKNKLYLLGHGFSIRNKESFIIELSEKIAIDFIQSLSSTFDTRWKHQNNVVLC